MGAQWGGVFGRRLATVMVIACVAAPGVVATTALSAGADAGAQVTTRSSGERARDVLAPDSRAQAGWLAPETSELARTSLAVRLARLPGSPEWSRAAALTVASGRNAAWANGGPPAAQPAPTVLATDALPAPEEGEPAPEAGELEPLVPDSSTPMTAASGVPRPTVSPPIPPPAAVLVDQITLSRTKVDVSGLATVPVTARARVRGRSVAAGEKRYLSLILRHPERPSLSERPLDIPMKLRSVDGGVEQWEGMTRIGSPHHGRLVFAGAVVTGCPDCIDPTSVIPVTGPSLRVVGSHIPRLTVRSVPDPIRLSARRIALVGRVLDSSTGRPYRHDVPVMIANEDDCLFAVGGERTMARRARGGWYRFDMTLEREWLLGGWRCARIQSREPDSSGLAVPLVEEAVFFRLYSLMTVQASSRSVRVGKPLTLRGRIVDADPTRDRQIAVRYLRGRSQWRTLATASSNGAAYSVTVRPRTKGRLVLRTEVLDSAFDAASGRVSVTVR